jgi:hypothetical protein
MSLPKMDQKFGLNYKPKVDILFTRENPFMTERVFYVGRRDHLDKARI